MTAPFVQSRTSDPPKYLDVLLDDPVPSTRVPDYCCFLCRSLKGTQGSDEGKPRGAGYEVVAVLKQFNISASVELSGGLASLVKRFGFGLGYLSGLFP
jgi:hypothetical protein